MDWSIIVGQLFMDNTTKSLSLIVRIPTAIMDNYDTVYVGIARGSTEIAMEKPWHHWFMDAMNARSFPEDCGTHAPWRRYCKPNPQLDPIGVYEVYYWIDHKRSILRCFFLLEVFNLGIQKIPHEWHALSFQLHHSELDLGPGRKGRRGNPDQRGGWEPLTPAFSPTLIILIEMEPIFSWADVVTSLWTQLWSGPIIPHNDTLLSEVFP